MTQTLPTSFPYLQAMDLMIRIEEALAGKGNMVILALKIAIHNKQPAMLIVQTCKDMIRDNRDAMEFILGVDLCKRIESFKP